MDAKFFSSKTIHSFPKQREVTLNEFVDKEYKQHADDNLRRTTPNLIDGFKPGQRKILFGSFKEHLDNASKEMKVAQLGASVAKDTEYHHGEQSLIASIINMAQDFVGSNNINVLEPIGQFGTRLMGGKDASSARYTFTQITRIAKSIFRREDEPILDHIEEDGHVNRTQYIFTDYPNGTCKWCGWYWYWFLHYITTYKSLMGD